MSSRRARQRRIVDDDEEEMDVNHTAGLGSDHETAGAADDAESSDNVSQLVKKLVRYALACEYSRTPIRRDGIREKVLGMHGRMFKKVFAGAQKQLRETFGMEMVELPTRDRNLMTTDQKRKAAKSQSQKEATSNAYILVTTLPEAHRKPNILAPSKVTSADGEASYMALYTMLISIITLSGGELSDARLQRHLARLNAAENVPSMNPNDANAPSEKTEMVLQRLIKQGYLVKVTEARLAGDEDSTTWYIGPRGKVEVNHEAIAAFVRTVYGHSADEDLEQKLQTSLKVKAREVIEPGGANGESRDREDTVMDVDGGPGPSTRRRGRRRALSEDDEDE